MSYTECKNKNEYRLDGNLYIRDIKRCKCTGKKGSEYSLDCKIIERGEYSYSYVPGEAFISRFKNKRLWLDVKAKEKIESAIASFEKTVSEAMETYAKALAPECGLTVFYKRNPMRRYDFVTLKESAGESQIKLVTDSDVEWMVRDIKSDLLFHGMDELERKTIDYLFESNLNTIQNNPFYISAVENNDDLFQKQLKFFYHIASDEDCSWLEKLLGLRVLPSLPEEYNKYYIVNIAAIDPVLLHRSGYTILHRPYFAMMNSTHGKWQLNPHTKIGVDAARVDAEGISFNEYLELFDKQIKKI